MSRVAKVHSAALRRLYLSSDGPSQLQTLRGCGLSRTGHSQAELIAVSSVSTHARS